MTSVDEEEGGGGGGGGESSSSSCFTRISELYKYIEIRIQGTRRETDSESEGSSSSREVDLRLRFLPTTSIGGRVSEFMEKACANGGRGAMVEKEKKEMIKSNSFLCCVHHLFHLFLLRTFNSLTATTLLLTVRIALRVSTRP